MNLTVLVGNVGSDPKIIEGANGEFASFSIATNEYYKNKEGQKVTETEWHEISVFRPGLVELAKSFITQGKQVAIIGKTVSNEVVDDEGKKTRYKKIKADAIELLGKNETEDAGGAAPSEE